MEWRLLDFGMKDGYFIQSVYEAVARAVTEKEVPNTIILVSPASPYVCIGIHQELEKEVNVNYCAEHEIPVIRRQTGGGAVYLDSSQQFYQIIVHKNDPSVPLGIEAFYEHFLTPTVNVYRRYGLPAQYRPINDVMINGKKASGNGAVTLGKAMVLIGNIICDMDTKTMVDVLKVPSEKFKDKMFTSLQKYMTSLQNEIKDPPHRDEISAHLIAEYESLLSCSLKRGTLTPLEEEYLTPVLSTLRSEEWLHRPSRRREHLLSLVEAKCTKVAGGVMVCEASHKAQKLIRITLESVHGRISDILISGDFFYEPAEYLSELEEELKGMKIRKKLLTEKIETFLDTHNIHLAGVTAKDFVEAIIQAHSKVKR